MAEPDLAHFKSIPWCSALISDPTYKVTPTMSRRPKSSTEDSLFAISLSSPSTIKHCLTLYKPPTPPETFVSEVNTLLTLGDGMNGGPNMLHGGIIATLLDEVMGILMTVNKDSGGLPLSQSTVTGTLTVKYLKVVWMPGTVSVLARCTKREGRRFWLEGELKDEHGSVMAVGEAIWVQLVGGAGDKKKMAAKL